jgi:pSer/pThr/pTyr-binding forkhead associated (FHA) protein
MHLEAAPRREEYRRAREEIIASCGQQTLAADQQHIDELQASGQTFADDGSGQTESAGYCLIDQDGVHNLKTGLNTIGRLPDNDIAVADSSVSRRHCAIIVHTVKGCEVYDTASKNGTFVNGQRISGLTLLKSGDKIKLCDRQFLFVAARAGGDGSDDANGQTQFES